jgi:hypothetical protein
MAYAKKYSLKQDTQGFIVATHDQVVATSNYKTDML